VDKVTSLHLSDSELSSQFGHSELSTAANVSCDDLCSTYKHLTVTERSTTTFDQTALIEVTEESPSSLNGTGED